MLDIATGFGLILISLQNSPFLKDLKFHVMVLVLITAYGFYNWDYLVKQKEQASCLNYPLFILTN